MLCQGAVLSIDDDDGVGVGDVSGFITAKEGVIFSQSKNSDMNLIDGR